MNANIVSVSPPSDPRIEPRKIRSRTTGLERPFAPFVPKPLPGIALFLSGPTSVGKGTLIERLQSQIQAIKTISHTTRAPRHSRDEKNGVDYHFVTEAEFCQMIADGLFLEYAVAANDSWYGTSFDSIKPILETGGIVIGDKEIQGLRQIRENRNLLGTADIVDVFCMPPGQSDADRLSVLRSRSLKRNSETPEEREQRLARALVEMAAAHEYSHIITVENDAIDAAAEEVLSILEKYRPKLARNYPCAV
jgi:guanylate kinase